MSSRENQLFELLSEQVKNKGYFLTKERLSILREITDNPGHFTAEELYLRLRNKGLKVSRATVYNNLEVFVKLGILKRVRLSDQQFYYENAYHSKQHYHLICKECGKVVEFCEPRVTRLVIEWSRLHKFKPVEHQFVIWGICSECDAS